ncbi:hypothetical protein B0J11DRAFT_347807 [Dendryphion nanum]|uniref:Uncharacterized protein n=1 Tax=Dendryphion nanum TaxID=256645 RepID=A0A9P9IJG7_9PLEO|nr:hypothetical protein B0J11DRAFT_347807 [Dendryphion nanum]
MPHAHCTVSTAKPPPSPASPQPSSHLPRLLPPCLTCSALSCTCPALSQTPICLSAALPSKRQLSRAQNPQHRNICACACMRDGSSHLRCSWLAGGSKCRHCCCCCWPFQASSPTLTLVPVPGSGLGARWFGMERLGRLVGWLPPPRVSDHLHVLELLASWRRPSSLHFEFSSTFF